MIADLKPYSEYKESGSPWLGATPSHWNVPRLGSVLRERGETNEQKQVTQVLSVLKDVGVIRYEDKGNIGNKKSDDIGRYKVARIDDIVVNCMNVIIGSVGRSRYVGSLSPVYYVLTRRFDADDPRYLAAVFSVKPFQLSLVRIGNGILSHRMRIPMELLKCEPFPVPPPAEQAAIVRFLDWANGRLERAIRAKRKVIALLNEQKQAIIHRAVTRGLDPSIPLKPSGIPWLGHIPQHWQIGTIGAVATLIQTGPFGSQLHSHEYVSSGIPVINPSHMAGGRLKPSAAVTIRAEKAKELSRHMLCAGDIVIARRGELGRCALVTAAEEGWICGTGSLLLRCKPSVVTPDFFQLVFSSRGIADMLSLSSIGATMANLNAGTVARQRLPLPPLDEQESLVRYIEDEAQKVEIAISRLQREIELLREYRIRLIADLVTGKLDARDAAVRLPEEDASDVAEDDTDVSIEPEVADEEAVA